MKIFLPVLITLLLWTNVLCVNAKGLFSSTDSAVSVTAILEDVEQPIADAGPDQDWSCDNPQIVLGTSNSSQGDDISYTWTNENEDVVGIEMMLSINLCGTYTLTVENESNGCVAVDQVTINCDIFLPYPTLPSLVSLNCSTSEVMLEPIFIPGSTEFASYEWRDENGNVISTEPTLEVLECAVYTFTMFSPDLPCPIIMMVNVSCDFREPTAVADLSTEINCETIMLVGNGSSEGDGFEYTWLDETGNEVSTDLNAIVSEPGTYTLIVTNTESGCTASAIVFAPDNAFSAEINLTLACENYIVKAFVDGAGFYEYNWSTGERVNPITLPFDEAYAVTITSLATGCELVLNGNTPEGPPPISTTSMIIGAQDSGSGMIDVTVTGGSEPYTFEWSNGAMTEDIEDLIPGEYTVTITDATGCVFIETFIVDLVNAIQKIDVNGPIKIYPNPSIGRINIDAEIQIVEMQIFDAVGKRQFDVDEKFMKRTIQLQLEPGVYYVNMKTIQGENHIGKLIIAK